MSEKRYRVLVKAAEVVDGGSKIERFRWVEVSYAQAKAYTANDPNWRAVATPAASLAFLDPERGPWYARAWKRLASF